MAVSQARWPRLRSRAQALGRAEQHPDQAEVAQLGGGVEEAVGHRVAPEPVEGVVDGLVEAGDGAALVGRVDVVGARFGEALDRVGQDALGRLEGRGPSTRDRTAGGSGFGEGLG